MTILILQDEHKRADAITSTHDHIEEADEDEANEHSSECNSEY